MSDESAPPRVHLPVAPDGRALQLARPSHRGGTPIVPEARVTKRDHLIAQLLFPEHDYWRPRTRADCAEVPRPCPYVSCRYNLYLDVLPSTGTIKPNYDCEPWEAAHTCALDLAEEGGGLTLEEVGVVLGLTRERVRQLEERALRKLAPLELPSPTDMATAQGFDSALPEENTNINASTMRARLTHRMRELWPHDSPNADWKNREAASPSEIVAALPT